LVGIASTLPVGIDPSVGIDQPSGRHRPFRSEPHRPFRSEPYRPFRSAPHRPFRSASTNILVGIDPFGWYRPPLVSIDQPCGQHRPALWSASTLSVDSSQPSGWHYALHSFLAVAILMLPTRPFDPHGRLAR
jgi:hypothetical protein